MYKLPSEDYMVMRMKSTMITSLSFHRRGDSGAPPTLRAHAHATTGHIPLVSAGHISMAAELSKDENMNT